MFRRRPMWILLSMLGIGYGQSGGKKVEAPRFWNDQDKPPFGHCWRKVSKRLGTITSLRLQ